MTNSYEEFPEKSIGELSLKKLGYGHAIGQTVTLADGSQILAEDFIGQCPGHVEDLMYFLVYAEADDPDLPLAFQAAQEMMSQRLGLQPEIEQ